ncbi:hypothetical protein [Endozoicomonas sp. SESOKO3]|nr:hypothetical protein [Endozoicomonas sp. SESOKO3]
MPRLKGCFSVTITFDTLLFCRTGLPLARINNETQTVQSIFPDEQP